MRSRRSSKPSALSSGRLRTAFTALSVATVGCPSEVDETSWVPSGSSVVSALAMVRPPCSMRKRQPAGCARSRPPPEVMSLSPIVKTWWGLDRASSSFRARLSAGVVKWPPSANTWSFDMTRSGRPDGGSGRCSGIPGSSRGQVRMVPFSGVLVAVLEGVVDHVGGRASITWIAHADVVDAAGQGASAHHHDVAPSIVAVCVIPGDVADDGRGPRHLDAELHGGQGGVNG